MKIYFYDGSSAWVCARRMEQGCMHWPSSEDGHVQLTQAEFAMLVGGIDLADARKRKWLRQPLSKANEISQKVA
jgi:transposase